MSLNKLDRKIKRDTRRRLRSALGETLGEMITGSDFETLTQQLWVVDDVKNRIGHQIRARVMNTLLERSPHYEEIRRQRKTKEDKKKTARLIKKALKELGYDEDALTLARDKALALTPIYQLMDVVKTETQKALLGILLKMPVWMNYLQKVKGVSVLTASKLMYIVRDVRRFANPSKLHKYLGLHVKDGKAVHRRRKIEADFHPQGQALVLGVIGENLIRQNSQYRKVYDERKARMMKDRPEWGEHPHGKDKLYMAHYHNDAKRVMVKRFIIEFWKAGWQAEGLEPPTKPYAVRILGHDEEPDIVPYESSHNILEAQDLCASHPLGEAHPAIAPQKKSPKKKSSRQKRKEVERRMGKLMSRIL